MDADGVHPGDVSVQHDAGHDQAPGVDDSAPDGIPVLDDQVPEAPLPDAQDPEVPLPDAQDPEAPLQDVQAPEVPLQDGQVSDDQDYSVSKCVMYCKFFFTLF